ncbi:hypothetical protein [Qipengyuania flava]|uniref:hypothetical protein n=1 Tax=Qipengyuania flava TaxID=192812 RepID=UPI001C637664|nr:hypothetical protein [Qipengyuania flava]QYJ08402.1 hypothetical protein KUV82_06845 [Qipengyuania flava]
MKPVLFSQWVHLAGALAATALSASCASAQDSPAPTEATPTYIPVTVTPAPTSVAELEGDLSWEDWIVRPRTPGDWSYTATPTGTAAIYGRAGERPEFAVSCPFSTRRIVFTRYGDTLSEGAPLVIRTETATGSLTLGPGNSADAKSANLAATDPLLDTMALTRGRFAVETAGMPAIYLPAWAEVTRVIEDCR